MKRLYIITFCVGILFGYQGMRAIGSNVLVKGDVLSQSLEVTLTPIPTETSTPVPTLSPTPTASPTPTLTPREILTPTPKPTPIVIAPNDLEPLFRQYSTTYNVDEYKLKRIAYCESHFNTGVYKDPYAGMYQFNTNTWSKYRNMMGKDPNSDLRFGARESIETAAYVISLGQDSIWPSCTKF